MSLDRAAVSRRYKQLCVELGLPYEKVVLSAGAALVLLGLRKYTSDLDVDVPVDFFEKHKARKGAQQGLTGELIAWDGMVDLHMLPTGIDKVHVMDYLGIWIYHPEQLIKQKEIMANQPERPPLKAAQDRKDIQALKECLDNVYSMRDQLAAAGLQLNRTKV